MPSKQGPRGRETGWKTELAKAVGPGGCWGGVQRVGVPGCRGAGAGGLGSPPRACWHSPLVPGVQGSVGAWLSLPLPNSFQQQRLTCGPRLTPGPPQQLFISQPSLPSDQIPPPKPGGRQFPPTSSCQPFPTTACPAAWGPPPHPTQGRGESPLAAHSLGYGPTPQGKSSPCPPLPPGREPRAEPTGASRAHAGVPHPRGMHPAPGTSPQNPTKTGSPVSHLPPMGGRGRCEPRGDVPSSPPNYRHFTDLHKVAGRNPRQ